MKNKGGINKAALEKAISDGQYSDIRRFIVDVSRTVVHIYDGPHDHNVIQYSLIVAEMEAVEFCRAAAVSLFEMVKPLADKEEFGQSFHSIYSAFKVACAAGSEDKNEMISHAVDSVMAAAEAAKGCSKTMHLIKECVNRFDRGHGYNPSYMTS